MNRDPLPDLVKTAAIFGVVFIHTPGDTYEISGLFWFCVPVFIAVWAMYFETGLAKRMLAERHVYFRSRLIRLVVPYLFWTGVYLLLFHPAADWFTTPLHTIVGGWFGGYGWSGQYFFIILFQLMVLFPLIRRCATPAVVGAACLVGMIVNPIAVWLLWPLPFVSGVGDRLFVYWLPYVLLGVGLSRGFVPALPRSALVPVAVSFLILGLAEFQFVMNIIPKPSPYLLVSVYLASVALILILVPHRKPYPTTHDRVGNVGRSRPLQHLRFAIEYVSRNTFVIFLANPLIIDLIPTSLIDSLNGGMFGELEHVVLTAFVVCGCLSLGGVLRLCRLGLLVGV